MKRGDLILFVWPDHIAQINDNPDWKRPKIGLFLEVTAHRPGDEKFGDEWLVLHNNERWSVPERWCRTLEESE